MRNPSRVMDKMLDCGLGLSVFELHWWYYVHFRTDTLGKGKKALILLVIG